eukprot:SAG31_NODE_3603_length_4080_cov_2.228586_4_plen_274_part_00
MVLMSAALCYLAAINPPSKGFPPSLKPGCLSSDAQENLFCPGAYGYGCFKIPSLLRIPNTTRLLAFIEARKYSCDDHGYVDLLLKVSDELGHRGSWGGPSLVYSNSTERDWHTIGDALPIFDRSTGEVHLVFTRDNAQVLYTRSKNAATESKSPTWEEPRDISMAAVNSGKGFIGTGHAHGIQLRNGTLLAPLYGGGSNSFVLRSDTHGRSWFRSGELDAPPNEWDMQIMPRGEPWLIASLRSSDLFRRQSFSSNLGATWQRTQTVVRQAAHY